MSISSPDNLKLPSELLYAILLGTVTASIHSIGCRHGTTWDVSVFTTLARVSLRFRATAQTIAGDVFGDEQCRERSINDAESLMHELRQLCSPEEWHVVASKYDERYPSNILHAYAVLTSAVFMRRAAVTNLPVFLTWQEHAMKVLSDISTLRIPTPELSFAFRLRCSWEKGLWTAGTTLVRTCDQINSLLPTPPGYVHVVSEEELARYEELSGLMLVVEAATIKYEHTCSRIGEGENPNVLQLPGVVGAVGKLHLFTSPLAAPITNTLSRWRITCPSLVIPLLPEPS